MRILMPQEASGRFGRWLAYHIFISGLTIEDFSNNVGISRRSILNHVHMSSKPTLENIKKYCDYFGEDDLWSVYDTVISDWG